MYKVAFYKAKQGNQVDKTISWFTEGLYSHCEIVISNPNNDTLTMYSSSGRDGGVRIKEHTYDENKWEYVNIELDYDVLTDIYSKTKHDKYDYTGILGFILPFKDRTNQWFCSEWVSNVLKCSGHKELWLLEPSKISPNRLYGILKDI